MGMKETLYGWYPPSKSQWKTHNQDGHSYSKECFYKFNQSRFTDEDGVRTPTPLSVKVRFASCAETIHTQARLSALQRSQHTVTPRAVPSRANTVSPGTSRSPSQTSIRSPTPTTGRSSIDIPCTASQEPYAASRCDSFKSLVAPSSLAGGDPHKAPSSTSVASKSSAGPPTGARKAWSSSLAETPITVYDPAHPPDTPYFPIPTPDLTTPLPQEPAMNAFTPPSTSSSVKRERAQSAKVRRDKVNTPVRPVQSARPYRGQSDTEKSLECRSDKALYDTFRSANSYKPGRPLSVASEGTPSVQSRPASTKAQSAQYKRPSSGIQRPQTGQSLQRPQSLTYQRPSSGQSVKSYQSVVSPAPGAQAATTPARPDAPQPPKKYGASPPGKNVTPSPIPSAPLDYEQQLKKHGWKMEIPGDPLNLKRPCLHPRQAFAVKMHGKPVALKPPVGRMENFDTFFMNTIPRKPLSFTIHPEMMSEVLHAKRMELQKRDGMIYQTKKFAFIY